MKYALIFLLFVCGTVNAEYRLSVFSCNTEGGDSILIDRTQSDVYSILYGAQNVSVKYETVRKGTTLGTSFTYSGTEGSALREVIIPEGDHTVTIGWTDTEEGIDGYLTISDDRGKVIVEDACRKGTTEVNEEAANFFETLTPVDNY